MHASTVLPLHPSMLHPLTGEPVRAIWRRPDGRLCWPVMGGSQGATEGAASGAAAGATAGTTDAGTAGAAGGTQGNAAGNAGAGNAIDTDGKDLGYPKDTPVAQMTDTQRGAYWQHQAQKHEGRFKNLVGDRSFDDTKKALEEYERIQKEQMTPAEQALTAAREEGQKAGLTAARSEAASEIFRGALAAGGLPETDINDLVSNLNVGNFISDKGIETSKLTEFAKRFTPSGKDTTTQRRDFGAGRRQEGQPARGAAGRAEAERRGFIKPAATS